MADDAPRSATDGGEPGPDEEVLEDRWEAAPSDPDLGEDLGYEHQMLDVLVTSNSDKKVMVLPRAEDWVEDDAYLIADFELACDPVERA